MGAIKIVPSIPVEPSATGVGSAWIKAIQGVRLRSDKNMILFIGQSLIKLTKSRPCDPKPKDYHYFHMIQRKRQSFKVRPLASPPGRKPANREYRASVPRLAKQPELIFGYGPSFRFPEVAVRLIVLQSLRRLSAVVVMRSHKMDGGRRIDWRWRFRWNVADS